MNIKKDAITRISEAARKKYGEMVSITNVIEFLFENHVCTYDGVRNYYIRERYKEIKVEEPERSDNKIFLDISIETDMSKSMTRLVVFPVKI